MFLPYNAQQVFERVVSYINSADTEKRIIHIPVFNMIEEQGGVVNRTAPPRNFQAILTSPNVAKCFEDQLLFVMLNDLWWITDEFNNWVKIINGKNNVGFFCRPDLLKQIGRRYQLKTGIVDDLIWMDFDTVQDAVEHRIINESNKRQDDVC